MGKDIPEKRLEDFNDVFADIHNALVFKGKEVLRENELVPLRTEAFFCPDHRTDKAGEP